MPYLQRPRLHFAGRFLADVSTVNNDPIHFDSPAFQAVYDQPQPSNPPPYYGWWNPTGSGGFGLLSCAVTRVCYQDGTDATSAAQDPAVGMAVQCVRGRLVDLDTEQQMVSQIFALSVSLVTAAGARAVSANYAVAPFTDIYGPNGSAQPPPYNPWYRIPAKNADEAAGAVYQSQLVSPAWDAQVVTSLNSTFLSALMQAAGDNALSIRFNVDAMVMEPSDPQFPTGRLVGTIGIAQPDEPQHLTLGRQIFSLGLNNPAPAPIQNPLQYNYAVGFVDATAGKLIVDLGNALPSNPPPGPLIDNGPVAVGYTTESGWNLIDEVPYTGAGWYEQTAAVVDLPLERTLTPEELTALASGQVQLATYDSNGNAVPQATEAADGTYVRADDFVLRMSPGDSATVTLFATQFGQPLAGATIGLAFDNTGLEVQRRAPLGTGPETGTPTSALSFPASAVTDANGVAQITITASDPGTPRTFSDGGFIDGQVYGIRPLLNGTASATAPNPSDFISVLVWSGYTAPANPTWWQDVYPIFLQYAQLYPVMKQQGIDLGDYASVTQNAAAIQYAMSLSTGDPGYMPVTRDLSPAKAQMILNWLTTTGGPNGGPNLGTPP